jgi:hypothetical protein
MDTVPTQAEAGGDFSASGVTIFDPSTSYANPNYNPALPVSTSNPQTLRSAFPNNVIPVTTALSGGRPDAEELHAAPQHDGRHGLRHDDERNAGGVRRRHGFQ